MIVICRSAPFAAALLLVASAVMTGLVAGRSITGSVNVATKDAGNTAQVVVLQESSDWLSEGYWRRRRENSQRQQTRRDTYDQSNLGLRVNPFDRTETPRSENRAPRRGNYRTVCVRLCDGYYFPISFSTTEARFEEDEKACQSTCSSDSRLFYYENSDGSPETMTDRKGRAYASLKAAFLYRTTYEKSCQCRPDPWSDEAKQRHATYLDKGLEKRSKAMAKLQKQRSRIAARDARKQQQISGLGDGTSATGQSVQQAKRQSAALPRYQQSNRMSLGQSVNAPRRAPPRAAQRQKSSTSWKRAAFSGGN